MRLVCPNCGAQYEVDDRVVPEGGRDVQCSACGHGWYQMPQGHEEDLPADEAALDEGLAIDEPDESLDETLEDIDEGEEVEESETSEDEGDDDYTGGEEAESATEVEGEDEDEGEAPAVVDRPARPLDDGVRSILQEEAQRELDARAGDVEHAPEQMETQPDLGLDDRGPSPEEERRRIARERMARMRGIEDEEVAEADFDANVEPSDETAQGAQGRAMFPDIEEINSTLDSHVPRGETAGESPMVAPTGRNGFGRGFALMIFFAVLLLALYVLAPKLATSVPALEPALSAYVEVVNSARSSLEGFLRGLIEKIEAAAASGS